MTIECTYYNEIPHELWTSILMHQCTMKWLTKIFSIPPVVMFTPSCSLSYNSEGNALLTCVCSDHSEAITSIRYTINGGREIIGLYERHSMKGHGTESHPGQRFFSQKNN